MESKNEIIKENHFNLRHFKIGYITTFAIMIVFDIVILTIFLGTLSRLAFGNLMRTRVTFLYYLILITPIVKVGFDCFETVRLTRFLKSDSQDKEHANILAKPFLGFRLYRGYYLVAMMGFTIVMEVINMGTIIQPIYGDLELYRFYLWFTYLLAINIFSVGIGPHLFAFSVDFSDERNKNKMFNHTIVWVILILVFFNWDNIMLLFGSFVAS